MPRIKKFHDSSSESEAGSEAEISADEDDGERHDLVADSDSDAAPDDVTFEASKKSALQRVKAALGQIEREKDKVRQKRRLKDEQFKDQKKKKLEKLAASKLPDDVLADLAATKPPVRENPKVVEENAALEGEKAADSPGEEGFEDFDEQEEEDFIALDRNTGIQAVELKEELKKSRTSAQAAADFIQKRMYGGKVPRESSQSQLARKQKKKARFR